jgi:Zn finger protein HypA/HybF involved in hydrogenase expression
LCSNATEDKNKWMKDAVVITPRGSILRGEYDGYGRVDDCEDDFDGFPMDSECYHEKCWEAAGKPTEYTKESRSSADQGWFFADGVHNSPPPGEEGFFHADEQRPRIECPRCKGTNTRQRDAIHFECDDCEGPKFPPPEFDQPEPKTPVDCVCLNCEHTVETAGDWDCPECGEHNYFDETCPE